MTIHPTSPPLLSILIPTLPERQDSFSRLTRKLRAQIDATESGDRVEILDFLDSREHTIGAKRNWLLDRARGEFVAFVDDDDDVSERYVDLIRHAIEDHPEIDCVGIKGTISFRGRIERTFVHSIRFRDYRSRGGTYQRPPYHLNPIRREIARRYRFADVSYSEDVDWAMMMCRDGALRREFFVDEVLYYYHSRRHWHYQWMLDRTELVRHALGLRAVNRIGALRRLRPASREMEGRVHGS